MTSFTLISELANNKAVDIIFIHGLSGDKRDTWTSSSTAAFWPELIDKEFENASIWTLDYPADISLWAGEGMPLVDRATNILGLMEAEGFGSSPIVLICHSLGGLVAKQILRTATDSTNPKWLKIYKATKGIMFIGTPSSGSFGADLLQKIPFLNATPSVKDLKSSSPLLRDLSHWFRNNINIEEIILKSFFETKKTGGIKVVDESSADLGISGVTAIPIDAGHISICKPNGIKDDIHKMVCSTIKDILTMGSHPKNSDSIFMVPFQSKDAALVGRETTLSSLKEFLHGENGINISQHASFQGLGGLGKTQLAVDFAHKHKAFYPNGIIWINADQEIDPQLLEIGHTYKWLLEQSSSLLEKTTLCKRNLRTLTDCLIIFDNVENEASLKDYLPLPNSNAHVITTSRLELLGFKTLPMRLLSQKESLLLLTNEAGKTADTPNDKEAVDSIIQRLDGLPLALEIAGAFIRTRSISWSDYAVLLEGHLKQALPHKFSSGSYTKHEQDLFLTVSISETFLEEEPLLQETLNILSWSGTGAISKSLLTDMLGEDIPSALVSSAFTLGIKLKLLHSYEGEKLSIHRLVREVRRETIILDQGWFIEKSLNLINWFMSMRNNPEKISIYESDFIHLKDWCEINEHFKTPNYSILRWIPSFLHLFRHDYTSALTNIKKAINLFEPYADKHRSIYLDMLHDLGTTYNGLGNHEEALSQHRKALSIVNNHNDVFSLGERAKAYDYVGISYLESGEPRAAAKNFLSAINTLGESKENEYLSLYTSLLNNISNAYRGYDDYGKAIDSLNQAYKLATDHADNEMIKLTILNNIAMNHLDMGKAKEAKVILTNVLEGRARFYGEKHPAVADVLSSLSLCDLELEDYSNAEEKSLKALEIRSDSFGKFHHLVAESYGRLDQIYSAKEDNNNALKYSQKALKIRQECLGNEHPLTAESFNNYGTVFMQMNKFREAIPPLNSSLEIRRKQLGESHTETAMSHHNLGCAYLELGYQKKATQSLTKALQVRKKSLGLHHPLTHQTLLHLLFCYKKEKRNAKAKEVISEFIPLPQSTDKDLLIVKAIICGEQDSLT